MPNKKFDAIIIGTGQAGPSLAHSLAQAGMSVAIVERKLFGGTCVNTGCTPTKALVANAKAAHFVRSAATFGMQIDSFSIDMQAVKTRKDHIVKESSQGLQQWLLDMKGCTVVQGHAVFVDSYRVRIDDEILEGKKIFINVGCRAAIPKIAGLERVPFLTNSSVMEIDFLPTFSHYWRRLYRVRICSDLSPLWQSGHYYSKKSPPHAQRRHRCF